MKTITSECKWWFRRMTGTSYLPFHDSSSDMQTSGVKLLLWIKVKRLEQTVITFPSMKSFIIVLLSNLLQIDASDVKGDDGRSKQNLLNCG